MSFWGQWAALVAVVVGCLYLASYLVGTASSGQSPLPLHKIEMLLALSFAALVYPKFGVFRRWRRPKWAVLVMSFSWFSVISLTFGSLYWIDVVKQPDAVSALWALLVLAVQPLILFVGQVVVRLVRSRSGGEVRCLVVGRGALANGLIKRLESNPFLPDAVIGLVIPDTDCTQHAKNGTGKKVLGQLANLKTLILQNEIDRIYVAVPMGESARLSEVQALVEDLNTDIVWVPDILSMTLLNPGLKEVSGYPLLSLSESPMGYFGNAFAKSFFDVVVASCMLLVLAPVMIIAAIAVKATSPGPVLYWQHRHGWDGSVFRIYKFRSMVVHEERDGFVSQATKNDARVTRVGRWLRRTSIDELPQLFNVLGGTMSLVGPRPHAIAHNEDYAQEIKSYMLRHRIKPGITGLAQINGLRGETETLDKMRSRVEYDLAYINDWSLWRDVIVLLRTPMALLSNRSVY